MLSANSLAFCKFNCLPIITEAVISAFNDSWKFNNPSDTFATLSNPKPSFLAWTAASKIFLPPSAENLANNSVLAATSFNTWSGATLLALANCRVDNKRLLACSPVNPCVCVNKPTNFVLSSTVIPVVFANLATLADNSSASSNATPKLFAKSDVALFASSADKPSFVNSVCDLTSSCLKSVTPIAPNCPAIAS